MPASVCKAGEVWSSPIRSLLSVGDHPVTDTATFVIRSSNDDDFHCNAEMISGHPKILDAVALAADGGYVADGLRVTASNDGKRGQRGSRAKSAMYGLEVGDLRVYTWGISATRSPTRSCVSSPARSTSSSPWRAARRRSSWTTSWTRSAAIGPLVVIPMHYRIPGSEQSIRQLRTSWGIRPRVRSERPAAPRSSSPKPLCLRR